MRIFFKILPFSFFLLLNQTQAQNNALNFDGSNDIVNCGNSSFQVSAGTIEAWVKTAGAGSSYRGIIVKRLAYGLFLRDNLLICYDWTDGERSTGVNLANNQWHHVAMSFQSGIANGTKIYIDGNLALTTVISIFNQNTALVIGDGGPVESQEINGSIDEVRIWNNVRTQAEIQANMNVELSSGNGLVAAYHFNQGVAGGTNTGITTLIDAAGSNTGTLSNFGLTGATSNWVAGSSGILPVELLNFTGKSTAGVNLLTWQTASETQNKGFDIERSTYGSRFEKIGFVAGNGTIFINQSYSFEDTAPNEGVSYYRLKQLDFDGDFEYSNIVSIDQKAKNNVGIFPNPGSGIFTITGLLDIENEQFMITNSSGQHFSVDIQNNGQLDLSALSPGVYHLRVATSGQVMKLVKE